MTGIALALFAHMANSPLINHQPPVPPARNAYAWMVSGLIACVLGIAAILLPIPSLLEVANNPPGTSMRPMGAAMMLGLSTMAGLFVVLPLSVISLVMGWRKRGGRLLGATAMLLGLCALFLVPAIFKYLITSRGYIMEP